MGSEPRREERQNDLPWREVFACKLLTHKTILQEVWGQAYADESHYLHVYVSQLRRKLEPDPARPRYILTEPGVGYRLVNPLRQS